MRLIEYLINFLDVISYIILFYLLLKVSLADYQTMLIPNKIIIGGIIIRSSILIVISILNANINYLVKGIFGMLTGSLIVTLIMLLSLVIFKTPGIGMGDLKLLAMIGLFIGSKLTLITMILAVIAGFIVGTILLLIKDRKVMPFGPFISGGAVVALVWGEKLYSMYVNFILY